MNSWSITLILIPLERIFHAYKVKLRGFSKSFTNPSIYLFSNFGYINWSPCQIEMLNCLVLSSSTWKKHSPPLLLDKNVGKHAPLRWCKDKCWCLRRTSLFLCLFESKLDFGEFPKIRFWFGFQKNN